jgi:hypothetical protein
MEISSCSATSLESTSNRTVTIPFDDDEIHSFTPDDDDNINMLFMTNETIHFKDGKGINCEVTYLGPVSSEGTLKHKIRTRNDSEFLVDGILLPSLDAPNIATIPLTPEHYANKLPKLSELELQQISQPQSLDDDQRKFMELHCKMNHLPFPAMIVLAEKGKIKAKYLKLKH